MADADGKAKSGGWMPPLIAILILTIIGGATGAFIGLRFLDPAPAPVEKAESAPKPLGTEPQRTIRPMAAIITNLAEPEKSSVRLQAALLQPVGAPVEPEAVVAKISEDIITVLRTWRVKDLEGATGLRFLREDLSDRVRIRTQGRVSEVVVQSLIVE